MFDSNSGSTPNKIQILGIIQPMMENMVKQGTNSFL